MEIFKAGKIYDFMGKKNLFISLSLAFIIGSIVLLFSKELNYGIDFSGGTVIQVKYTKDVIIDDVRAVLKKSELFANASITEFGSKDEIVIKINNSSSELGRDIGDLAKEALVGSGDFEIRRVDMVGAKVGGELREKGLEALFFAILAILIYVSIRFEWRFALTSVIALAHDVIITLGFVILFDIEINLDILAAFLTLVGYSLNDTIIVFDRIRESMHDKKLKSLSEVINFAVSNTLSRTTLTSLTTFFVIFTLYLFGGEIIHGFSFTLLVGIIVGTYSSIFIAASMLVWFKFSVDGYREKEALKLKRKVEKERMRAQFESGVV